MLADTKNVLRAIVAYVDNYGWAPSYREICELTAIASTSSVHGHLLSLEQGGYIRLGNKARQIALTDKGREVI